MESIPKWVQDELGSMVNRWRRKCGRPGGADVYQQEANRRADEARKECVKDVEAFLNNYRE